MRVAQSDLTAGQLSLWHLAWPIAVEMLLQVLMGTADSIMVSRVGDNAVSAVGLSNQVIQTLMTIFVVVNGGAGVVVARKWGAGKLAEARVAAMMTLKINAAAGIVLSVALFFAAEPILRLLNAPLEVLPHAVTYLSLVGAAMVVTLLHMTASSIVRNTGNTKGPMMIAVGMNILHLILNYGFIFGELGLPKLGLLGVCISTIISRLIALAFSLWLLRHSFQPMLGRLDLRGFDMPVLREMIAIGLPAAVTAASWGYSQIVLLSIVSSLGATALAAYTYMNVIQQFPWMLGSSAGQAVQIQVGQLYGARQYNTVFRTPFKGSLIGMGIVLALSATIYAAGDTTLRLFTSDAKVIAAALPLFALCIVWQPMRTWTFAITNSLISVGEARFVAVNTFIGMWLFAVGGSYVFAIVLDWGIIGVLTGLLLDEAYRTVLVSIRWLQRKKLPKQQAESTTIINGISMMP